MSVLVYVLCNAVYDALTHVLCCAGLGCAVLCCAVLCCSRLTKFGIIMSCAVVRCAVLWRL